MRSGFGIDHGDEFSKGVPSGVRESGGGLYGSMLRQKKRAGKNAAKFKDSVPAASRMSADSGRAAKEVLGRLQMKARVDRTMRGEGSRAARARLLNEDSHARREWGLKTGKSSALDRGYRGRVSHKMTELP